MIMNLILFQYLRLDQEIQIQHNSCKGQQR